MPYTLEMERARTLAEDARRHYVDGEPQDKIAFDRGVKPSTVSRRLRDARGRAVVAFSINPIFGVVGKDVPHLGRKLRERFELDDALVVDVGIANHDFETELARDDYIHLVLANRTGAEVVSSLRPKHHIALGPGRPVHQIARLVARSSLSAKDLTITSLCGRLWAHSWDVSGAKFARPMDADDAAFIFASAFEEQGVHFNTVVHRLFAANANEARTIMASNCPFRPDGQWVPAEPPTRVIIGIGAVDPQSGHRIADLYREQGKDFAPYLLAAADDLKVIIKEVEKRSLPYFGDVMNRYFPVLKVPSNIQPADVPQLRAAYAWLHSELEAFNGRIVAAQWPHLRQSKNVSAVAGGSFKFNAIWSLCILGLLRPENRIISELNTDSVTAEQLLKALDDFESADTSIKDWFRNISKTFFTRVPDGVPTSPRGSPVSEPRPRLAPKRASITKRKQ